MNDILVPTWIAEREAANALKKAKQDADAIRQIAASIRVEKEGPEFWEQLLKEFSFNINALARLGLKGQVIALPAYNPVAESSCRLSVLNPQAFPQQSQADFFYTKRQGTIRCSMMNGGVFTMSLCVFEDGIKAITDYGATPLSAKELAEEVVKRMVDSVNS
jgi:hypothetical protein